jgi:16S rRNA (guanine527-N7)-methyltransferase
MADTLAHRISERARLAGIALPDPLRDALHAYYALLFRWNAKINLTALSDGDEAIDRLLLEPVAAAVALPPNTRLTDLGSGGGSPAIPLALTLSTSQLVMVESRSRKAAFLREAAHAVGLRATVVGARFEELSSRDYSNSSDIVSMRAVRMDGVALEAAVGFLRPGGILALFVTAGAHVHPPNEFSEVARTPLPHSAELLSLRRGVPRGTLPQSAPDSSV